MNPPILNQITLIGVGLIGGSFVLDLKRLGLVRHVTGIDVNESNPFSVSNLIGMAVFDEQHVSAGHLLTVLCPGVPFP